MKTDVSGSEVPTIRKSLRLWPGVVAATLIVLGRWVLPAAVPEATLYGIIAGVVGAAATLVWWIFFSRAPWSERIGALVVTIAAYFAIRPFLHESISGGMMGRMFAVYAIPAVVPVAFVAWAAATRRMGDGVRRVTMIATIFIAAGLWTLLRTEGIKGEGIAQLQWRWTTTPEERLLARADDVPLGPVPAPAPPSQTAPAPTATEGNQQRGAAVPAGPGKAAREPAAAPPPTAETKTLPPATPAARAETSPSFRQADWPGFRGPQRDSIIRGVQIKTDWTTSPPVQVWRRPIGPGWSSFAIDGDRIYTQEQRGEEEVVSCYTLSTGQPVWRHADPVRFYESNGGAGPRATPTLHNGRVYTLGATGILNALDARNGAVMWSRNAASYTGAPLPGWGFAGSPLVVDDLVIVATSGRLAGYDLATGTPRWTRATGGGGYSSPHLLKIDGVPQVVLLSGAGATSVAPRDGSVLWSHSWNGGVAIVQPALAANGDVLIALGDMMGGTGIRRIAVSRNAGGWMVEERWTSRGLKPYFNDFVVHKGHAYGFDGSILACIDLENGERKWKGGRYGQGQMVLLPDQDVLLIVSEEGELALVKATPDQYTELARLPGIEGKTWNHPVILRDLLLVRNGEEMAAFRLSLAQSLTSAAGADRP